MKDTSQNLGISDVHLVSILSVLSILILTQYFYDGFHIFYIACIRIS